MTSEMLDQMEEAYFLSKVLPEGWKVIRARYGKAVISLIISPNGKKFETLQKAHEYMEEERVKAKKRRDTSRPEKSEVMRRLFEAEDTPLALSESARYKRKYMANKNPFRNLLKRTLEKNHIVNASQSQSSINYQKYLIKNKKRNLKKLSKGL